MLSIVAVSCSGVALCLIVICVGVACLRRWVAYEAFITSCRRAAARVCPRPSPPPWARSALRRRADGNVAVLPHAEYIQTLTAVAALRVKATLSKAAWWPWPLTFDPESGIRVTCDVGYLCANFGLSRPLCSRLRPDVRDRRQTDVRQTDVRPKHRLMPHILGAGHNNECNLCQT